MNQRITDIIVSACEELDCNYQDYSAWFMVLIDDCLKTMKTSKVINPNLKTKVEVYDNKVVVPTDVLSVIYVSLSPTMDPLLVPHIEYKQQGDIIIFAEDIGIQDGDFVYIQYKGLRKDEEGNVVHSESWNRMLIAYIGWKFCRRYLKDKGVAVMQDFKREYIAQKAANL